MVELPLERARLERVFINLLGNALEAMPAGGEITISAALDAESVTIQVADNGPGISADIRDHLFQPFVSSGNTHAPTIMIGERAADLVSEALGARTATAVA